MISETNKITLDIIISACEKMKRENELSEMGVTRIMKMCDCLMGTIERKKDRTASSILTV